MLRSFVLRLNNYSCWFVCYPNCWFSPINVLASCSWWSISIYTYASSIAAVLTSYTGNPKPQPNGSWWCSAGCIGNCRSGLLLATEGCVCMSTTKQLIVIRTNLPFFDRKNLGAYALLLGHVCCALGTQLALWTHIHHYRMTPPLEMACHYTCMCRVGRWYARPEQW